MNRGRRGGLASKLAGAVYQLVIALAVILIASNIFVNLQIRENTEAMEQRLDELNALYILENEFSGIVSDFRAYMAYGREEFLDDSLSRRENYRERLRQFLALHDDPEWTGRFAELEKMGNDYFQHLSTAISLNRAKDKEAISNLSQGTITPLIRSIESQFATQLQLQRDDVTELTERNRSLNRLLLFIPLLILGVAVLFAYRLRRYLEREVIAPVREMEEVVQEIGGGQFLLLKESGRSDEIGQLAHGINVMTEALRQRRAELDSHLAKLSEQHDELEAQNEEIMAQQLERQEALEKLREREATLETISSFQEQLAGFTDMDAFLRNSLSALVKALGLDAIMLVARRDGGQFERLYSQGYPSSAGQPEQSEWFGPALRVLEEGEPIARIRPLSGPEQGVHGGYEHAWDRYFPLQNGSRETSGFLLLTIYGAGTAFASDDGTTEGLVRQFGLAYMAQLEGEARKSQAEELARLNVQIGSEKQTMEEQRDRFRRIVDSLYEGLLLTDAQGSVTFINQPMYGLIPQDLQVGMNVYMLATHKSMTTAAIQRMTAKLDDVFAGRLNEFHEQLNLRWDNGEEKAFELYMRNLYQAEGEPLYVFVLRDRTEEEAADRAKNEFVSIVSHELRTPLASIMGFVEIMLKREVQPAKRQKYLETVHKEAVRLSQLIGDFLDLQRMESGKQSYARLPFDLREVVETVASQYKNGFNHLLQADLPEEPCYVKGDRDRTLQVLHNLISNAIKYSPGADKVDVRVVLREGQWTAEVQDYGLGIPEEAKNRIFSKFYRVDNSDRRQIGGTGLGLSIVKEIMEGMGGRIGFESVFGEGSTFWAAFERFVPEPLGGKIFVVEDDDNLAGLIRAPFEESGYEVYRVNSAEEALLDLRHTGSHLPLLLIVDIQLKGTLTGWDVVAELVKSERLGRLPVIVSSVLDRPEHYADDGQQAYLQKPFALERLLELGEALMNRKPGPPPLVFPAQNEQEIRETLAKNGFADARVRSAGDVVEVHLTPPEKEDTEHG